MKKENKKGNKEEKKIIGIVGWKTGDNSFGVTVPYLEYFSMFGDVHVISPTEGSLITGLDLLVLPGGKDVDPLRYNRKPGYGNTFTDPFLEYFDKKMLKEYIGQGIPIFGICRGLQTLNVHFGGTLNQTIFHEMSNDRSELVHKVRELNEDNSFGEEFMVNSLHHQAIGTLAQNLIKTLIYVDDVDDKLLFIEGIKHRSMPIHAVQYHPEEIYDTYCIKIISNMLNIGADEAVGDVDMDNNPTVVAHAKREYDKEANVWLYSGLDVSSPENVAPDNIRLVDIASDERSELLRSTEKAPKEEFGDDDDF